MGGGRPITDNVAVDIVDIVDVVDVVQAIDVDDPDSQLDILCLAVL